MTSYPCWTSTFAYLAFLYGLRRASTSSSRVGMNRHDQPRSRNEEAPLSVARWRLVLGALAVGGSGAAGAPGPCVFFPRRARVLQRGLEPRHHHVGVGSLVGLVVRLLGGNLAAAVVGPVHPALPPAGLVQQLHGSAARRVRVQEEFRVLQNRPTGITSDLHDLDSRACEREAEIEKPRVGQAPLYTAPETFARDFFFNPLGTPEFYCAKVKSRVRVAVTPASLSSGETKPMALLQVDAFLTLQLALPVYVGLEIRLIRLSRSSLALPITNRPILVHEQNGATML